jgi:hypothetical protein
VLAQTAANGSGVKAKSAVNRIEYCIRQNVTNYFA